MSRWIGFLELRGFYASAHEAYNRELAKRPFAVIRSGEVLDLSPAAEAEGARRGIKLRELRWVCPGAVAVEYEESLYRGLYHRLWDAVYARTPVVEPTDWHEGFFDATGCLRAGDSIEQWRGGLMEALQEALGLTARTGLAPTRSLARMAAAEGKCLGPGEVQGFLREARPRHLPLPLDTVEALERLGVRRVGELVEMPAAVLYARLGPAARRVRALARGEGDAHVQVAYPPLAVNREFGPIEGLQASQVRELLRHACRDLHEDLASRRLSPTLLRLTLDPLDGRARTAEVSRSQPFLGRLGIEEAARRAWHELWHGETLARAVIELSDFQPQKPRQYGLEGQAGQVVAREVRLRQAREAVTRRFGDQSLVFACQLPERSRFADRILARQATEYGCQVSGK